MKPSYDKWKHRSSEKRTEDLRESGENTYEVQSFIICVLPGTAWALPLRGHPRVGKTGSASLKQVIPNAQYAAGRVRTVWDGCVGAWRLS